MGLVKAEDVKSKVQKTTESPEHREAILRVYNVLVSILDMDKRHCYIEHPVANNKRADLFIEYIGQYLAIEILHKHFTYKHYVKKEESYDKSNLRSFYIATKECIDEFITKSMVPNKLFEDLQRRFGGIYYLNPDDTLGVAIWDAEGKEWVVRNKSEPITPSFLIHHEKDYQEYVTRETGYCLDYHSSKMEEEIKQANNDKKEAFNEINKEYEEIILMEEEPFIDYSFKYDKPFKYEEEDKEYIMELIELIEHPTHPEWSHTAFPEWDVNMTIGVKYKGEYYHLHSPTVYIITVFLNEGPGEYGITRTSGKIPNKYTGDLNNKMECRKLD